MRLFRAEQDEYPHDTNFSDLPDLPSLISDEMCQRSLLTRLNKLNDISRNMQYDEDKQIKMFQHKKVKLFKSGLSVYNKYVYSKIIKKKLKVQLPVP